MYTFNGNILTVDNKWTGDGSRPLPPTPAGTRWIRVQYLDGYSPTITKYDRMVQVSPNVWDVYYDNANWTTMFLRQQKLVKVLAADTTGVTNMSNMFSGCDLLNEVIPANLITSSVTDTTSMFMNCHFLRSVPAFDLSNAANCTWMFAYSGLRTCPTFDLSSTRNTSNMFLECPLNPIPAFDLSEVYYCGHMFKGNQSATSIPDFDLSNSSEIMYMFAGCNRVTELPNITYSSYLNCEATYAQMWLVETGITREYQKLADGRADGYLGCFFQCGMMTDTGSAELAQIPNDWK